MSLIVFLFAIWSSVFTLGRITVTHCPPLLLTSSRMILAGFILLLYLLIFKRKDLKINKNQFFAIIVLGILSMYFSNALEYWGQQKITASKTCFIYSLTPFFAAIFSFIHFKERMNLKKWAGMAIGLLGVIVSIYLQSGNLNGLCFFSLADLAIVGATLFSVYGWIILRLIVKDNELSPITANALSMFIGGFFALFHSFIAESWHPLPISLEHMGPALKGILLMTFISNVICYNIYGYLLKKYTATFLSFVGLLSPLFASLNEWLILKEPPSFIILISTAIVMIGLWIIYQEEIKQGYIKPKSKVQNT